MIKKWNKFILESVSKKELSDLKDKSENFIGEDEMNNLLNDDQTLWNIVSDVLKYAEWRYDVTAKEIADWYISIFGKFEGWVGSEWKREISKKKYGDKSLFISKVIDFYNKVKDEFELVGGYRYPKISELSKDVEMICISSLDKIEFWEVFENYENLVVRCGIDDKSNIDVYFLDDLSEELVPMCKRIEQELGLKNDHMSFEQEESKDYLEIVLGFVRVG